MIDVDLLPDIQHHGFKLVIIEILQGYNDVRATKNLFCSLFGKERIICTYSIVFLWLDDATKALTLDICTRIAHKDFSFRHFTVSTLKYWRYSLWFFHICIVSCLASRAVAIVHCGTTRNL